ncbi:MAG: mechanosensitive ion channel [Myxococcota bacterium]|nr:mechanosensitive ion channel [Myxococcota bacterium]
MKRSAIRHPTFRALGVWLLTLGLFTVGPAAPARAQEVEQPVETAAPEEPKGPEPVPIPETAERSEALRAAIREIRAKIAPDPAVAAIDTELAGLSETLADEKRQTDELLAGTPTRSQLGDVDRRWIGLGEQLADWRKGLSDRSATIEEQVGLLDEREGIWTVTLETVTAEAAPQEVVDAIRANLAEIASARKEVEAPRSEVLALLNRVSDQEAVVADARSGISDARSSLQARLFFPDGDPLWAAFASDSTAGSMPSRVSEDLQENWRRVVAYLSEAGRELVPLAFLFLVALGIAYIARRRIRELGETHELHGSAAIFERPVSIAILVTLLLFAWAFRDAPTAVLQLVGLALVFPMLRLGATLVATAFRPILFIIGGFYLADGVRDLLASQALIQRILLLFQCGAAVGLLYWMLRPSRLAELPPGSHPSRWIGTGMQLGGVLLVASILANLFGYVSFADVLAGGVFGTVYLGVVLYAAFKIAQTVLVLGLRSESARKLSVVRSQSGELLRWAPRLLGAIALYFGARGSLSAFGILEPVQEWVVRAFTTPLAFGESSISLWSVTSLVIVMLAAWVVSRIVQAILNESVLPRVSLRRGLGSTITTTVHYLILVLGFLLALSVVGIDMTKFTILAGAFGVGIGFGLQNIVNNFVSGLILLYERPIQVGDTLQLADLMGTVTRIGVRSSTLRTFQGAEVIVPNANLIAEQVVNWTLSDTSRRVELPVGVAYGCDHEQVLRVLDESSAGHPDVLDVPPRQVLFQGFGESSLDFQVRLWTRSDAWTQVASDVLGNIYRGLNDAGIEIPFPQRDLHVRSVDDRAAQLLLGDAEPAARRQSGP